LLYTENKQNLIQKQINEAWCKNCLTVHNHGTQQIIVLPIKRKNGIPDIQRDEVPKIRFLLITRWVSLAKQFQIRHYYLQFKQAQFVDSALFGQVR